MSGDFQLHHLSSSVIGAMTGLALAIPAAAGDWSTSFVARSLGQAGSGGNGAYVARSGLQSNGAATLQAGFDHDYGELVIGGTVRQGGGLDITGLGGQSDSQQLHLRAGYDFGDALGYVTLGEVQHGASSGLAPSQVFGLGLRVSVNRVLQMTGEFLHHDVDSANALAGQDGDILSVRAAFRF